MSELSSVYLIRGDEPSVISHDLEKLVNSLLGDEDKSLVVEELIEENYLDDSETYSTESLLSAVQTVPFLTEKRVIIARDFARFARKEDLEGLLKYLENPIDVNYLILVWEKGPKLQRMGQIPKILVEKVTSCGQLIDVRVGRKINDWIRQQVAESSVMLDDASIALLENTVGDEVSRVPAILATLESVFGNNTHLQSSDVEQYLGQSGNVPPWELVNKISTGNAGASLEILTRMQSSGAQHQMQILGYLSSHYFRLLQLSGRIGLSADEAMALLGDKSNFRSKKTLSEANRLGDMKVQRAVQLLAEADLDLRGGTGVPPETVMEILVARLSSLYIK
ncbi:MAG: DNA polymerase III subunit delta [Acidimicrobiaceae bacterium]|nr:DNA polymerase III subunit delta [Acidimicrobiaceae bacterium]